METMSNIQANQLPMMRKMNFDFIICYVFVLTLYKKCQFCTNNRMLTIKTLLFCNNKAIFSFLRKNPILIKKWKFIIQSRNYNLKTLLRKNEQNETRTGRITRPTFG